jgi:hypothetical protein
MIFLIEYNRPEGRIVTFTVFEESERRKAESSRLEIELELNRRGVDHEVVCVLTASVCKPAFLPYRQTVFGSTATAAVGVV